MDYKKILVTGGAGFVGSNISISLKKHYGNIEVIALDNLYRKGSELNIGRLKKNGVRFVKGDVRVKKDLEIKNVDLLIECSAEPSVMAGVDSSPEYLLETNLVGAINCFEFARKNSSDVVFLSTSRVYPIQKLNGLLYEETETRFVLKDEQKIAGASKNGIQESFPIEGVRSLYGTTKLSAELILQEYIKLYRIRGVINRCGLIAGPWQMGKIDQGIIAYIMSKHVFNKPYAYIGFGGKGKQVRDVLHVDDLFDAITIQMQDMDAYNGSVYNIGGGVDNSISLVELTNLCHKLTGKAPSVNPIKETRLGDVRIYISDTTLFSSTAKWNPKKSVNTVIEDVYVWFEENKSSLKEVFA